MTRYYWRKRRDGTNVGVTIDTGHTYNDGEVVAKAEWLAKFDAILQANRKKIDELVKLSDSVETSKYLRSEIA